MNKYLRSLLIAFSLISAGVSAQDIHFSMFYATPLTLNPAMTGAFDGTYRVGAIYRNQYRSVSTPFVTYSASFDMRLLQNKLPHDIFGAGLTLISDKSGDGKLTMNSVSLSAAFHKGLDKAHHHYIGLGVQMGYTMKSLQYLSLTYPGQYDLNAHDFINPYNDIITKPNVGYFDMNAGIVHQSNIKDVVGIMTGISVFHLVPPKESFLGENVNLAPRITGHFGLRIKALKNFYVNPNFIYQYQNKAQEINLGSSFEYHMPTAKSEFIGSIGVMYRVKDAAIITLGAEYYKVRLMFAYDINASGLTPATNGRGAFEIAAIFTGIIKSKKVIYPVLVPCPMM